MKRSLAVLALLLSVSCGPAADLSKAGTRLGVILGDIDPTLVGTFRLWEKRAPAKGMFLLLVLRSDLTFHGQYVAACQQKPCEGVVEVEGQYRQKREMPNPSRASKISLSFEYADPGDGKAVPMYLVLNRGWVEGSPQIGLFHLAEGEGETAIPFFELSHPTDLWCASPDDCEVQETDGSCRGSFGCENEQCFCQ